MVVCTPYSFSQHGLLLEPEQITIPAWDLKQITNATATVEEVFVPSIYVVTFSLHIDKLLVTTVAVAIYIIYTLILECDQSAS